MCSSGVERTIRLAYSIVISAQSPSELRLINSYLVHRKDAKSAEVTQRLFVTKCVEYKKSVVIWSNLRDLRATLCTHAGAVLMYVFFIHRRGAMNAEFTQSLIS